MAVLPIRTVPDPVLRQKAKRVNVIDGSIPRLADNMIETMRAASGVGLAGPQVGIPLRIIVIGIPEKEPFCLINPQIVRRSGERVIEEGCLSIPGYVGEVKRAVSVTCKGLDAKGREVRIKGTELLAQALEHEINHLNGVLYTDQLTSPDTFHKVEPKEAPGEPDESDKSD
ncbi:MAG: peptide deformylase [Chloroflexi bacterium RBG_16_57_8]|nr:MAG: peptide deformylase [Chloroflexi bacterium RBG_16_57_8]